MLERMDDTVFNLGACATSRSYYFTNEGDAVILRPDVVRVRPEGRRAVPDHRLRVRLSLSGSTSPRNCHFPMLCNAREVAVSLGTEGNRQRPEKRSGSDLITS